MIRIKPIMYTPPPPKAPEPVVLVDPSPSRDDLSLDDVLGYAETVEEIVEEAVEEAQGIAEQAIDIAEETIEEIMEEEGGLAEALPEIVTEPSEPPAPPHPADPVCFLGPSGELYLSNPMKPDLFARYETIEHYNKRQSLPTYTSAIPAKGEQIYIDMTALTANR